jgi:hypothetical protein
VQHPQCIHFGLQHVGHRRRRLLEECRCHLVDGARAVIDVSDAAVRLAEFPNRGAQGGLIAEVTAIERDRRTLTGEFFDDSFLVRAELTPTRQQQRTETASHEIASQRKTKRAGSSGDQRHAVLIASRCRQRHANGRHLARHSLLANVRDLAWSIMPIDLAGDRGRSVSSGKSRWIEVDRFASASPVLGPEALVEPGLLRS